VALPQQQLSEGGGMNQVQRVRCLAERIESRLQQRNTDPLAAANEIYAEGRHSPFDMHAAPTAVQECQLAELSA
jgi:hypothetical protein